MPLEGDITQLYEKMDSKYLKPLWTLENTLLLAQPHPKVVPWMWKWADLYPLAEMAGDLVTIERGGDRRALALANPGLGGLPFATSTMWAAIQWLNGREIAPTHRHTSQALRFVIDGRRAYSTVQGDKVYLERGDFALNPPWYWHDHGSESDERSIWMDGLDIPLNNYLDASFFQGGAEDQQKITEVIDGTIMKYGVGQLRPAWEEPQQRFTPLSTYKWATTEKALLNLAKVDHSPFDDVAFEYTNPHTGRPVLDTITAWIQMLRPGVHTKAHRHVNSSVYYAFEGRGATVIGGTQFNWEQGDLFVIPTWAYHEHINESRSERAILFSMHDTPLLKAVGKYREEALSTNNGHQKVREVFDAEKVLAGV